MKILISWGNEHLVGGIKIWWGSLLGRIFHGRGGMSKFWPVGEGLPHPHSRDNTAVPPQKKGEKF